MRAYDTDRTDEEGVIRLFCGDELIPMENSEERIRIHAESLPYGIFRHGKTELVGPNMLKIRQIFLRQISQVDISYV